MAVGERQLLRITLCDRNLQSSIDHAVAPASEHGRIDVGQPDLASAPHLAGKFTGQIASATGNIEDTHPGAHRRPPHRECFPEAMQAARHQIVHQVISISDGSEDLGYPVSLGFQWDRLITKMRRAAALGLLHHERLRESAAPNAGAADVVAAEAGAAAGLESPQARAGACGAASAGSRLAPAASSRAR